MVSMEQEFTIDMNGFGIHAKIDFPKEKKEKMPLVLLCHGLTGHMEEWHIWGIRDSITDCGYICLRIELYGHGKTDGAFYDHDLEKWVEEICFCIDYAKSLPFVSDVVLAGHSQGGLATIMTAGVAGEKLKAIIPLSPALNIPVDCRRGDFFGTIFDPEDLPETVTFWECNDLGRNYFEVAQKIDATEAIRNYTGPVLLVHGGDDGAVPCKYSVEAAKEFPQATLALLDGDGHCYEHHLDLAKEAVETFLRSL